MTAGVQVLRFENVVVEFDDERALDKVSFEIREGETCVILGAASSGKTVILKTALRLIRPQEGEVWVFGREISRLPERDLVDIRARIGVLFQEGGLFDSLNVEENVAYPLLNRRDATTLSPEEVRSRVTEVLRFVELEHTLEKFPSELSGGMRRRVGIARATVANPDLLLYDSPTAGLDPITANLIIGLLLKERAASNITSIIVTQRFQDGQLLANFRYNPQKGDIERDQSNGSGALHVTRFIVLQEGRLAFQGSEAELRQCADPYVRKFVRP
jgi:phospholipid/cholesterol/gamma-HCH transport system ATP-binding protein